MIYNKFIINLFATKYLFMYFFNQISLSKLK